MGVFLGTRLPPNPEINPPPPTSSSVLLLTGTLDADPPKTKVSPLPQVTLPEREKGGDGHHAHVHGSEARQAEQE